MSLTNMGFLYDAIRDIVAFMSLVGYGEGIPPDGAGDGGKQLTLEFGSHGG